MAATFRIKQHDLKPSLQVVLLSDMPQQDPGLPPQSNPVNLTQATAARLLMSSRRTGLKVSGAMTIADQSVVANLGLVTYDWQAGDTDTVGQFDAEIEVTWPTGKPQTFPANQYFTVDVQKDLGP